jgi:hypothetical protein
MATNDDVKTARAITRASVKVVLDRSLESVHEKRRMGDAYEYGGGGLDSDRGGDCKLERELQGDKVDFISKDPLKY